jgi:2-oxoglutarate dehydrogenase E1 component
VRKLYTESLIGRGDITGEEAEESLRDYQQRLERAFLETKEDASAPGSADLETHAGHAGEVAGTDTEGHGGLERPNAQEVDEHTPHPFMNTAISVEDIQHLGNAFVNKPEGFTIHPKLAQLMARRADMVRQGGIDWATAELLAFGSLLREGVPVRLSGQDSRRGTFVQRHAVLIDKVTAQEWTPLQHLDKDQASFWIYDSLLSEFAAMGFEYGYSVERPDALVLWEAQFGDFAGGAQTIVDEFISSSQQKWGQRSSVVLVLPHGYEGQGPDHSSARIERFLQLCAEDNMKVAYPSTPASYFHLLRRQAYRRPRRPLIVFTPKSMLRLKAASSAVEDFTSGSFRKVLPDPAALPAQAVTRVLLASGKVIYDLEAERARRADTTTAILRVEQLAPVPADEILAAVKTYPGAEIMWVQDEPANQGAWPFMAMNLPQALASRGETRVLHVASRVASASPATGSSKKHALQQAQLIATAFDR